MVSVPTPSLRASFLSTAATNRFGCTVLFLYRGSLIAATSSEESEKGTSDHISSEVLVIVYSSELLVLRDIRDDETARATPGRRAESSVGRGIGCSVGHRDRRSTPGHAYIPCSTVCGSNRVASWERRRLWLVRMRPVNGGGL